MFRSGFVALLGSANVGKSTLMNAVIGEKVAIVSKKPQTTRNRITGIYTRGDVQLVFLDTPGIHAPKNSLGEYMVRVAEAAAKDVDVVLFVVDAKTGARERDQGILENLPKGVPVLVALNKVDAVDAERAGEVEESLRSYGYPILRISAKTSEGIPALIDALKGYAQEGPMFFPGDMLTDQPKELLLGELIREQALKSIGKEIPHGIGVALEKLEEEEKIYRIDAVIYTEKDSHKGIIIGAGGKMLKKIASAAREEMEAMLHKKAFLQIWVKVKPDWRNKQSVLRSLGYYE